MMEGAQEACLREQISRRFWSSARGPIVIGQAAEFDYAGTQACLALKEEGYEVILANSNPATIMTDTHIADKVYMEPLTLEYVAKIIRYERPDAIVPGLGGQTGLNLAVQLAKKGVLEECQVEILGTSASSRIERAEDRELFKELCESLGEPVLPFASSPCRSRRPWRRPRRSAIRWCCAPPSRWAARAAASPTTRTELRGDDEKRPCSSRPVHQVLVEKSIKGYKEIEYEVMRDAQRHRHRHLQHGEHRPGGHPHRRLHRGLPRARRSPTRSTRCCATAR